MGSGSEATQFKPGQVPNPRGRPKGSRHRLSEAFLAELSDDFERHGLVAIRQTRLVDPAAYVRVVAGLLPKQSEKLPNPLSEFTDDELERLERILAREPSENPPGEGETDAGE